jgi:hypothetical protein
LCGQRPEHNDEQIWRAQAGEKAGSPCHGANHRHKHVATPSTTPDSLSAARARRRESREVGVGVTSVQVGLANLAPAVSVGSRVDVYGIGLLHLDPVTSDVALQARPPKPGSLEWLIEASDRRGSQRAAECYVTTCCPPSEHLLLGTRSDQSTQRPFRISFSRHYSSLF